MANAPRGRGQTPGTPVDQCRLLIALETPLSTPTGVLTPPELTGLSLCRVTLWALLALGHKEAEAGRCGVRLPGGACLGLLWGKGAPPGSPQPHPDSALQFPPEAMSNCVLSPGAHKGFTTALALGSGPEDYLLVNEEICKTVL